MSRVRETCECGAHRPSYNQGWDYELWCRRPPTFPDGHVMPPGQCDQEKVKQLRKKLKASQERKKRRAMLPFSIDRRPSEAKRRKWDRETARQSRERSPFNDWRGGGEVSVGLHVKLEFDDSPPSEWEEVPLYLNPEQARIAAIMKHKRTKAAMATKARIERLVRQREAEWDW